LEQRQSPDGRWASEDGTEWDVHSTLEALWALRLCGRIVTCGEGDNVTVEFHDPGELVDRDLELVLVEKRPGDPSIGYVPAYRFKMKRAGRDGEELGSIELRVGNTERLVKYGGHIGYGVRPEHRGNRYAARACRLLLPLARSHDMQTLWITCNPDNIASRKTCELVGARLVEIVDLPEGSDMYQEGERKKCRYRLDL
jgi:tagatose 1,6-diphosphate aldolase